MTNKEREQRESSGDYRARTSAEAAIDRDLLRRFCMAYNVKFESNELDSDTLTKGNKSVTFYCKRGRYRDGNSKVSLPYFNPVMRAIMSLGMESWVEKKTKKK